MSTTMDIPEESQIHLKRNRACLQCKKRKVKCDGVRPVCLPCTRTANSARRGSDAAPTEIQCTWADEVHGHQDEGGQSARPGVSRKKVSGRVVTQEKVDVQASRVATLEAERDSFKARLEQLEARLAALSTPSSQTSYPINQGSDPTDTLPKPAVDPFAPFGPGVCPLFGTKLDMNTAPDPLLLGPAPAPGWSLPPELDFTQFFVIPSHWPKNLPAPYLLEHLIDTFFNCVPQAPRILHRAKLLRRLQLQPNHPNFPLPALLHAICAAAAPHTAWVNSLPPGAVYGSVNRVYDTGKDLEESEDFGLSQAEASRRAYHQGHHRLWLSQGDWAVQNLQTQALLMGVWHSRGLFGAGGACLGDANRLIKELELTNRIHRREGINSWINPPTSDIDREERLGVVWYIFMFEAFSAVGSYWSVGLDDRLLLCSLPAGSQEFQGAEDRIQENPQDARSPDLFTVHPIADPYVLACKAALLSARVRRALNEWTQRRPVEGDKLLGMEKDDFRSVYRDTILFQQSIPDSIKHIFRVLNSGSHRVIDYNVLAVHLMPNLSILMLFEPFVVWDQPNAYGLPHILKAIDGVMSVIHHIPSNFDITLGMNGVLTYNLQVCAQFINQLIEHAVAKQAYAQAIRYRTDFTSIKDLLKRLGGKHAVAYYSTAVLEGTLQWRSEGFSLSEDLSASQDNTPSPPNGTSTTTTTSLDIMPDIAFGSNNGSVYVDPHMVAPAPATHQPSFSIEGQIIHTQPEQDIAPTASFMPFDQGNNNHMAVFTGLPIPHLPSNVPIQPLLTPGVQPMSTYPLVYPSTGLDPGAPVNVGSVPIATDLNGISAAQLAEVYGSSAGERNTFVQS